MRSGGHGGLLAFRTRPEKPPRSLRAEMCRRLIRPSASLPLTPRLRPVRFHTDSDLRICALSNPSDTRQMHNP
ncbi:hypothetical protein NDU88_007885 [Pleurodeles waltl]|uniref:Uncharacterized protein n=1 Tax=Pleurodeles waltl TaxID=8319 RepID=A0AAV7N4Y8_PLEWA|nr:hypothetical protein NDU88_007885 [Pleurodeles waltl]